MLVYNATRLVHASARKPDFHQMRLLHSAFSCIPLTNCLMGENNHSHKLNSNKDGPASSVALEHRLQKAAHRARGRIGDSGHACQRHEHRLMGPHEEPEPVAARGLLLRCRWRLWPAGQESGAQLK